MRLSQVDRIRRVFDKLLLSFKQRPPCPILLTKLKNALRRQKEGREGDKEKGRQGEGEKREGGSKGKSVIVTPGLEARWPDSQNSEGIKQISLPLVFCPLDDFLWEEFDSH